MICLFKNPFKKKEEFLGNDAESGSGSRIVIDPNTGERLIVRRTQPKQATPQRASRPSFGGNFLKGAMSEIDRKNRATFGPFFGNLLSGGLRAPGQVGQEIGGELAREYPKFERGVSRAFAARDVEKQRQQAFKQSPSYFHKQKWEEKTKPLLEKVGMGHIEFESYVQHKEEFERILNEKLAALEEANKPKELPSELGTTTDMAFEMKEGKPVLKQRFDSVIKRDEPFDVKGPREIHKDHIE